MEKIKSIFKRLDEDATITTFAMYRNRCNICGNVYKNVGMPNKAYPANYDFNCCEQCNNKY